VLSSQDPVTRGPQAGSRLLLRKEMTSLGRSPVSDIFLDDMIAYQFRARDGAHPQQELPPPVTRSAALPYLSFTIALMSSMSSPPGPSIKNS